MSTFATLNSVDITDKVKKKNGMNYLPWSSAWEFVKTRFPDAWYEVSTSDIASADGMIHKCNYFTDGKTCWVETTVHIGEETQSEQLPVLDFKNKAVSFETVDSAAVNKAIKRCLTKNLALFGLGLSLWNGEELSDNAKEAKGELTAINKETLSIATEKASKSEKAKKAVGDLVAQFVASKNVMSIKDIDKAKELNKLIKEL